MTACSSVRRFSIFILGALWLAAAGKGFAAGNSLDAPHLKIALISEESAIAPGQNTWLGIHFQIEPGWHVYWINPGDSGQPPQVNWVLPSGLTAGPLQWPYPERISAPSVVDYGYNGSVLLMAPLHADPGWRGREAGITANLRWLVCRNICIPGRGSVAMTLPAGASPVPDPAAHAIFEAAREHAPRPVPETWKLSARSEGDSFVLDIDTGRPEKDLSFFPLEPGQIDNVSLPAVRGTAQGAELRVKKSDQLLQPVAALQGVLVRGPGEAYAIDAPVAGTATGLPGGKQAALSNGRPLGLVLAFAFLGGLILNLMPCVFPVLSFKAVGLLHASHEDRLRMRAHSVFYAAGVLICFWILLGLLLALRQAGRQIGWGFQLQSPAFVVVLAALLFFLGLSLAGVFEIGLSWMGLGSSAAARPSYTGAFFTGVLATVVATPCTAPFMGSAVGFALSQSAGVAFATFTALAVGLALPYVAFSCFPQAVAMLPKPGRWMEGFKQALAFPLFAAVIWLVWVYGQQAGINAAARLLAGLLGIAVGAWLLGRFRSARLALPLALAVFALSLWFPLSAARVAAPATSNSEGLHWEPFSAGRVQEYQSEGKPVFVDFTAAWCLTCQVNERTVFASPEVRRRVSDSGVALLKADWTSYDPVITQTLTSFGRSGVPFYLLYGKDRNTQPAVLPELLTPKRFLAALHSVE